MPPTAPKSKLPFFLAFALVGAFYAWTSVSDHLSWHWGREQTDYYNLLVDGFLQGKLSLAVDVPPELLRVTDPYDPAQRPAGVALHDASLFRGKYYIYHGVVPAVVLLLPSRLVTGLDLPLGAAVLAFVLAGYALMLVLLARVRDRYFPAVGPASATFLAVVLGFATCTPILLRRSSMYDLPIASGYAFAMAALVAFEAGVHNRGRRVLWLMLSSLAWGAAIGSRPIYLAAPFSLLLAYPFINDGAPGPGRLLRRIAIVFAPLLAAGALLAAYNYARFGSVGEFGVRYILSGVYEAKIEHFRLRYLPWNLFAYLFAPVGWMRYFPFHHDMGIALPRPEQHFGMDIPFGLLVNVPFLWLAVGAGVAVAKPPPADSREWRALMAAIAWLAISVGAFLFLFYAAMARYLADFTPALALLAVLGAFAWLEHATVRSTTSRIVAGAVAVAGVISVFNVTLLSMRIYGRWRQFNPRGFEAVARVANAPVHAIEDFAGAQFGPLALELQFPAKPGGEEELVSTGYGENKDRVVVFYPDAGHIELAYEHAGAPAVRSVPLAIDGRTHRVKVWLGSLFPPATHPRYANWSRAERIAVLRRVCIEFDDRVVLEQYQRFHDASPATLAIAGAGSGRAFSGRIVAMTRDTGVDRGQLADAGARVTGGESRLRPDDTGTLRLGVRFPLLAAGSRRCLVASGETGRGDVLFVEYLDDRRLRLILDHWGRRPYLSDPIGYSPDRECRVEIRHPFYAPGAAVSAPRAGEGELTVDFDGRRVWSIEPLFYPIEPEDIFVGFNPIGGSSGAEDFTGAIRNVPSREVE